MRHWYRIIFSTCTDERVVASIGYILQLFYHVLDKMKRRQVHLDEAWSLKREKNQVFEGGNEQTKDDTGPVDLPQCAMEPTLPTATST